MKKIIVIILLITTNVLIAKFIWPPYLTNQGETYATINFKTLDENIQVKLYEDNVLFKTIDNIKPGLIHLKVEGLKPSTKYIFEVITNKDYYKGFFNTKNNNVKEFKIVVYGDTRYYDKLHRMIVENIIKENPEFVVNIGDMVENGKEERYWNNFFNVIKGLNSFYYPILGNHEKNAKIYYDAFDLPKGGGKYNKEWYSFSYSNYHFIILDSEISTYSDLFKEETEWLKKDLKNNNDKTSIIFYHYPFWNNSSVSWRRQFDKLEKAWRPIFEKYNVKIVFNGHVHAYERFEKNGIIYITTGGGGAPFDAGEKKELLPFTKKIAYGILEYVVLNLSKDKIKILVKGVGESKDFNMHHVTPINKLIDFVEIK
jgi:predicted phosphodiesterase